MDNQRRTQTANYKLDYAFSFSGFVVVVVVVVLWLHPWHTEVPELRTESELQLQPMPDSLIHCTVQDQTEAPVVGFLTHWATVGTPGLSTESRERA